MGHVYRYVPYGGTPVWVWVCLIPPDSGTRVWVWVCLIPPDSGTLCGYAPYGGTRVWVCSLWWDTCVGMGVPNSS